MRVGINYVLLPDGNRMASRPGIKSMLRSGFCLSPAWFAKSLSLLVSILFLESLEEMRALTYRV